MEDLWPVESSYKELPLPGDDFNFVFIPNPIRIMDLSCFKELLDAINLK
jgi:hypothetical protein